MKIKSFVITAVLMTAVLCFAPAVKAQSVQEQIQALQAQIQQLLAQIKALQSQQGGTTAWCHTFNANIGMGQKTGNQEVDSLIKVLQKEGVYSGSTSSDGYDENLASAVTGFQEKYASEILTPSNLKHGTGYVGKATRAKLNALYGCEAIPMPQPTCSNLWWIDNTDKSCSTQKQFCGAFMYYGLQTFKEQADCLKATVITCTLNWQCDWGECKNGYQSQVAKNTNNCGIMSNQQTSATPFLACPMLVRACATPTNNSPTISGVSGPTTLNIGQTGTWTINASDPENGTLIYSVVWGDEVYPATSVMSPQYVNYAQTTTFTHSYARQGNFTATFYVKNSAGNTANSSISVKVGIITQ